MWSVLVCLSAVTSCETMLGSDDASSLCASCANLAFGKKLGFSVWGSAEGRGNSGSTEIQESK